MHSRHVFHCSTTCSIENTIRLHLAILVHIFLCHTGMSLAHVMITIAYCFEIDGFCNLGGIHACLIATVYSLIEVPVMLLSYYGPYCSIAVAIWSGVSIVPNIFFL